jgi:hypothetical protein
LAIEKNSSTNDIINEAAYAGNIGIMELITFYKNASIKEKEDMQLALSTNNVNMFLKLIKSVVGTKLKSFTISKRNTL